MPVISMACPKCGRPATEYDESKWQCLHCGIKFVYKEEKPPVINVHQVYQSGETVRPVLCCPTCGNSNVQLKKMVYEAGTQTSSIAGVGAGTGGGFGVGGGVAVTKSLLADRCRPPQNTEAAVYAAVISLSLVAVALLIVFGVGNWWAVVLLSLLAIGLVKPASSASDAYQRALRTWTETVICLTCGDEFFTPEGQQHMAEEKEALERQRQLESERKAERARDWDESKKALRAAVENTPRAVNQFAGSTVRQTDRLLWTMAGGAENTILHHFFVVLIFSIPMGVLLFVIVRWLN